jgi:uncharacterized transporter YbjL
MKAWIAAGIALVGALVSSGAMADGNELLKQCEIAVSNADKDSRGVNNAFDAGYCFGTVNGVVSSMVTMNAYLLPEERVCFPDELKQSQGARIVVKYFQEHPASLHRAGPFLVMAAFQNAYPCKK